MPGSTHDGRGREVIPLAVVLFVGLAYALTRYVFLGTTAPANIPVYIINKVLSFGAAVGLLVGGWSYIRRQARETAFWLRSAGWLALLHILLTLTILNRAYFDKLFAGELLNLSGELTVLSGALMAAAGVAWRRAAAAHRPSHWWGACTSLLLIGHLVALGWAGWLAPQLWPGGLPPISLLGFIVAVLSAAFWAVRPGERPRR